MTVTPFWPSYIYPVPFLIGEFLVSNGVSLCQINTSSSSASSTHLLDGVVLHGWGGSRYTRTERIRLFQIGSAMAWHLLPEHSPMLLLKCLLPRVFLFWSIDFPFLFFCSLSCCLKFEFGNVVFMYQFNLVSPFW